MLEESTHINLVTQWRHGLFHLYYKTIEWECAGTKEITWSPRRIGGRADGTLFKKKSIATVLRGFIL